MKGFDGGGSVEPGVRCGGRRLVRRGGGEQVESLLRNTIHVGGVNGAVKITTAHRSRMAVVYVRQSTVIQVREHAESTARQYGLADVAVELGEPPSRSSWSTRIWECRAGSDSTAMGSAS
ncbi:hypothetical protein [Nocardia sp. CA-120079]|uniref:hypothetical protein n=1 Tax=Nocardia sp. CA-120079 TaxID=3239974 RepID=UPI003D97170B